MKLMKILLNHPQFTATPKAYVDGEYPTGDFRSQIIKNLRQANIALITLDTAQLRVPPTQAADDEVTKLFLSNPFKNLWVEFKNVDNEDSCMQVGGLKSKRWEENHLEHMGTTAMGIFETAPGEFDVITIEIFDVITSEITKRILTGQFGTDITGASHLTAKDLNPDNDIFAPVFNKENLEQTDEFQKILLRYQLANMVAFVFEQFQKSEIGSEQTMGLIRFPTGKKKDFVREVRQIVRVIPKRVLNNVKPLFSREIDFSHQWEVRGHWRVIPGKIGKDRENNIIFGHTWVKEHVKGPDDKPLIKKVRVI